MSGEPDRTVHAQGALQFTDIFAYKFGNSAVGGSPERKVKLMAPDAMSTAGGKQARQSMVLVAGNGDQRDNLVCGWMDSAQRAAELRSFNFLNEQYEARFNRPLDLRREDYETLLRDLEAFLRIQKIDYKVLEPVPRARAPAARVGSAIQPAAAPNVTLHMAAMLGFGIIVGLALGYVLFGLDLFQLMR